MSNQTEDGKYMLGGGSIKLDPVRESYIIKNLDALKQHNKFSSLLECLIRLAYDDLGVVGNNPELINKVNSLGMSPCAKEFYSESAKELKEMHSKIDAIYDMCIDMYTMCKFGKTVGIEKKVENMARAEFMCEKQTREICNKLGIEDYTAFKSAKIDNVGERAENALAYIIDCYDNIVSEIKTEAVTYIPATASSVDLGLNAMNQSVVGQIENLQQKKESEDADKNKENSNLLDFEVEKDESEQSIKNDETRDFAEIANESNKHKTAEEVQREFNESASDSDDIFDKFLEFG